MTLTATTDPTASGTPGDATPWVLGSPAELRRASSAWRVAGRSLGLVPTMGALHPGHRSLIRRAVAECDRVVVSIFVNPRQFAPDEDLARYPRSLDADMVMLREEGVHAAFVPPVAAMYPIDAGTTVTVRGSLAEGFEAVARPGHLDGVATVVAKLLIAASASRAYFGQKDAQQVAVVRRLAADLDIGTEIVVCPTVRDQDGLALSSRNAYLSLAQRQRALAIPAGLADAVAAFDAGERDAGHLVARVRRRLVMARVRAEYVGVVDPLTFAPVTTAVLTTQIVVAARVGNARLIDTVTLGSDRHSAVLGAARVEERGASRA